MNRYRSNVAITEIIGSMILLLIAVGTFSLIHSTILSDDGPEPETYVKIMGEVIGSNVIMEHQGGESLELDTEISITIAGTEYNGLVSNWLNDKNNNGEWNLGR